MISYCQYPVAWFQSPISPCYTVSLDRGYEYSWVRANMRVIDSSANVKTKA